jgi:hypothetical protein
MNGIILPAVVNYIRSKMDGSISITIETQELNSAKAGEVFSLRGKICAVYISPKEVVTQTELDQIDALDPTMPGKTKSQRQRAVLYRIWELQRDGHKTFESFYAAKMEAHISDLKGVLESLTV